MKKLFFVLALTICATLMLAFAVGARDVYLEEIPDELKVSNDKATHFVVFEEEKYFTGSGSTIDGLDNADMDFDMAAAGIDSSKIGTEYLTKFNFPAYFDNTLVTYVNLNSIKSNKYFDDVCGYIRLAGTVNKIHDMNDSTYQLRCIDFGENSQIKEIPYCLTPNASRLMAVKNFPRNLDTIRADAFNKCYNAFKGELYLNAKSIESSSFNNALSHITGLVLGPNVASIANQSLCVRLSEIPASSKPAEDRMQIRYIEFQCDVSQVKFAEQGNNKGAFYFTGTSRSPYYYLETIILSHPNNASKISEGSVFNDFASSTVLFNDSDGLDDYVTASHDFVDGTISYEDFLLPGTKTVICTKCSYVKAESVPAIFECYGYSASTYSISFSIGYAINAQAKAAYEQSTGLSLGCGVVAAVKANLNGSLPLDEDGKEITLAQGQVINAYLGNSSEIFYGVISGFTSDEQMEAKIVLCGYVLAKNSEGEIVSISYLQEAPAADGSLFATSYDSVKETTKE